MKACGKCADVPSRCDCTLGVRPTRFDGAKFFAALDTIRLYRRMSWGDVAAEAGVNASTLTRIAQGKRPDVDNLCRLLDWGHLPLENFIARTSLSAALVGDQETSE